jgi:biotin operon repressor/DNA-binding transcriptional ArsR family regulator
MAGGRLTINDRRSIAAGLAEGLSYAGIARQIGRPTSTISREVARNGHSQYAADRAQQATRRSGRKRAAAADRNDLTDRAREFVDEFASLLAGTGMPRMASRVFVGLITSPTGTRTAAELVSELRVSPASVSKAIGYLESMELAERQREPRSRRERYSVGDDIWTRAIRADSSGHAAVADAAQRGLALFGADTPAGIRLARMSQFFGALTQQLRGSGLADPGIDDAMTIIAALGYAQHPVAAPQLASALGWPRDRLNEAIRHLRRRATLGDPFLLSETVAGYSLQPRPDRLSADQRAALNNPVRRPW